MGDGPRHHDGGISAREIEALGGGVHWDAHLDGPRWPLSLLGESYARLWRRVAWVELNDRSVTDADLAHLAGLTNLAKLLLCDTPVTDAGVEALRKKLPRLMVER